MDRDQVAEAVGLYVLERATQRVGPSVRGRGRGGKGRDDALGSSWRDATKGSAR
jgi:hypothetical protein